MRGDDCDAAEMRALGELAAVFDSMMGVKFFSADTNLRLERIQGLVDLVGSPQAAYSHVHVGGTSGKGSVAAATAAVLTGHGVRVGLHMSPYVQALNETWQLDGRNIAPSVVLAAARRLADAQRSAVLPYGPASCFEFKVALAFCLFRNADVGCAVVEVGLGGALDATNVMGAGVKVLTNVGLDHTDVLGNTVEEIAADKVGIFRPGGQVVSGVTQPTVRALVRAECQRLETPLWLLDEGLTAKRTTEGRLHVHATGAFDLVVKLPVGWRRHQDVNTALALAAAQASLGHDLDAEVCARALTAVSLPARVEVFEVSGQAAVLDGAHNEDKLRASLDAVKGRYPGRSLVGVVALKADKDVDTAVRLLAADLDAVVFTRFSAPPWTCVPPSELAEAARRAGAARVEVVEDPIQALTRAENLANEDAVVLVTGSLYLAGHVRQRWVSDADAVLRGGSYVDAD